VIGELRAGGSERQLYYLLKTIDRARYHPEVVVWNFKETDTYVSPIRDLDVPIHGFAGKLSPIAKLMTFRRIVRGIKPQVVHSYSFHTNFAAFWGTQGIQSIAVGGVRSDFEWTKKESGAWLGKLSAYWPRKCIFNSSTALQSVQCSKSWFTPKQCWVVRNGVDLELFRSEAAPNRTVTILGVGSLFQVKRWDRLIAAAHVLKRARFDFRVCIAGDGPLRDSLKQQVQKLGLADCVEFIGETKNVPKLMANATFLVHTADKEGCPNAVMEAMACGRAVVATDAGDVPNIIDDGVSGSVVPSGHQELLIDRITTFIRNPQLCATMGLAARAKAEREFGLETMIANMLSAYRSAGWNDR